ncbi:hypothetical protein NEUTE1DRAFT_149103 [Neurospora tetrasperma FGSC 2508]|uniref:Uncharacterized protein n=1 Tax=Neurospora tetrasperma (strain FGSC 2508 / ATCC MYA-4615 / P0657) TaxID=510951 RepID=F8MWK1_NEUT8|nr:uncharacterized protein NEUTE1DRAFT_149103 [Neurospora tetrasperma FGSC 2508]EGO54943.1 hypothetical protein NEUTE1DRAFT_149103 [Neurospora tetrasperma FGSC 2508]
MAHFGLMEELALPVQGVASDEAGEQVVGAEHAANACKEERPRAVGGRRAASELGHTCAADSLSSPEPNPGTNSNRHKYNVPPRLYHSVSDRDADASIEPAHSGHRAMSTRRITGHTSSTRNGHLDADHDAVQAEGEPVPGPRLVLTRTAGSASPTKPTALDLDGYGAEEDKEGAENTDDLVKVADI